MANDLFAHPANGKADSAELTAVQHKAAQALEREFWKPGKVKVDGAPDLTKSSKVSTVHSLTRQMVGKRFQFWKQIPTWK